jgi:hypothetical protein
VKVTAYQNGIQSAGLLAICITIFILIAWQMFPFLPDDAYISFRYAENLASGKGLRFNAEGMLVEGYTNFLWIALNAVAVQIGLELPHFAPLLGASMGLMCIVLFWFLLKRRRLSPANRVLPLLLLSCSGPFVLYSISGMEMPLFSLLLLLGVLCFDLILHAVRPIWFILLSLVSFLLALCRPEGVIFYPVLVFMILSGRRIHWNDQRSIGISSKWLAISSVLFIFLLVLYELWRVRYFGQYLPTPFFSKGVKGQSLLWTWATNAKFFLVTQNNYFTPFGYYYFSLLALVLYAILDTFLSKKQFPFFEMSLFIIALVYILIYMNFIDWMPGMRYHAPLVVLLLISSSLLLKGGPRQNGRMFSLRTLKKVIFIIILLTINLSFVVALRSDAMRNEESTQESLVELGRWLKSNVPSNTLLAISDIGATPYYSGLSTLDTNPKSLTDMHIVRNGWSNDYFFKKKPGIAIFVSFSLTEPRLYQQHHELLVHPKFTEQYRLIGKTRYDWYRDRCYWIYAHDSLYLTDEQLSTIPRGIGQ